MEFAAKLQKMIEILDFCFVKSPKKQYFYDIKHFFYPKTQKSREKCTQFHSFSVLLLPVSKYERIVMKQDLKVLAEHIEKKVGKAHVFHKMWDVLKGKEKPSRQTLDKLALLAGFQSWDDFQGALHGTEDGLVNYDAGEK